MADEKTKNNKGDFDPRTFIGAVTSIGAAAVVAGCKSHKRSNFVDRAPDGPLLKAGIIGCGQRGTGAALNFLKAGKPFE